ncbi:hypothetical protein [Empedobacter brevis]|uniref:PepSY domain-containing protein n=1 Tax=Empedobacter brevis NBRC 14943 = ATCC 43319 TaxID=1218108 RepID=A0A511NII7_9FLAO|nr:hypothetical protein [Empedobacter brevis]GEM52635.1 hypothetical protein EB1_24250 [Empedobacter brevis NBRC 14943 = ATCC 43319]
MKYTSFIVLLFLFSISNAQNNRITSGFKSCEESFYIQTLFPIFGKSFVIEHFKMDSVNSYFNYIDYTTNESYLKAQVKNLDTIKAIPTEYVLILNVIHNDQKIGFVKVGCHYQDNLIRADKWKGLKDYLKPQLKVIEGKVINLEKALKISKNRGYEITSWEIDYETKQNSNDYKIFFPRLIWTLKEQKNNRRTKVLQINAKNGRVIKEYQKFTF